MASGTTFPESIPSPNWRIFSLQIKHSFFIICRTASSERPVSLVIRLCKSHQAMARVCLRARFDALEPGRDLREQFKPLASQRGFEAGEPRDVATRAVESRDDAAGHGVGHVRKDNRDRPRLALEGNGRRGRAYQENVGVQ